MSKCTEGNCETDPAKIHEFFDSLVFLVGNLYDNIDFSNHTGDPTFQYRTMSILHHVIPNITRGYGFELQQNAYTTYDGWFPILGKF